MESQMPIKKKKKDLDKKEQSQRSYPSWDQDQLVSCKHWGTLILIKRHTHTHTLSTNVPKYQQGNKYLQNVMGPTR